MKELIIQRLRKETENIIKKSELTRDDIEILAIIYKTEIESEYSKKLSDEHEENKKKFSEIMKNYLGGM